MTNHELSILTNALKEIQDKENECFRQMAYMNEHKFEMERAALSYKQEAYNNSWLILLSALHELKNSNPRKPKK